MVNLCELVLLKKLMPSESVLIKFLSDVILIKTSLRILFMCEISDFDIIFSHLELVLDNDINNPLWHQI